jgi:protein-S-isoprenylcysteine O-methyltransferase Ste14
MSEKVISITRLTISALLKMAAFFAIIFLSAGTIDYWQGWAFIAVNTILAFVVLFIFKGRSALLKERLAPGPGMKWWDKVFYAFYIPGFFGEMIIAPLDVGRYGWSENIPASIYILAYILFVAACIIVIWAMYVNDYFSSVVRIQEDRGHKVIQEGPYAIVRHPGYLGVIPLVIAIPLIMGSYYALISGLFVAIPILIRTYLEDKTLQKELPGYKEYAKKVKYRLIPYIW